MLDPVLLLHGTSPAARHVTSNCCYGSCAAGEGCVAREGFASSLILTEHSMQGL